MSAGSSGGALPRADDVSSILEALHRSNEAATEQAGVACSVATLNLVAYIDDAAYRDWVIERAACVAKKHPSRLIVLDGTRSSGGAEVSTSANRGAGTTVLNQRIDLDAGGMDAETAVRLVHALSMGGAPTVLWWSSADMECPLIEALAPHASTVVVDSSGAERRSEALSAVAGFASKHVDAVVRDLAYMRLAPWQEMIAQFFDDPALFEDLFSLRRLEVAAGSDAETTYLAAWLASRLSWRVIDRSTFRARDGHTVVFERTKEGERRRVSRVALTSVDSVYTAALSDDCTVVCLSVTGTKAKPSWYTPLQSIDNMSLLERATISGGKDQIFLTTLDTVRGLL